MNTDFRLPRFYPIIDTAVLAATVYTSIQLAEQAAETGVRILQYRHKNAWTQANYDEAEAVATVCGQAGISFVVNDRADYAHLLGAGLHVGQDDLPPVAARKVLTNGILGFSTHNGLQLRRASEEPADYLSLGPIFATTSKERPDPVVGLSGLKALRILTSKPLVAIGGITCENAAATLAAGASSVAVISGLTTGTAGHAGLKASFQQWLRLTNGE